MTIYAHALQDTHSPHWYVRPLGLGPITIIPHSKTSVDIVVEALNAAYDRGRSDVQSQLRDLIGAAQETET